MDGRNAGPMVANRQRLASDSFVVLLEEIFQVITDY
jgi:hypothetical protein